MFGELRVTRNEKGELLFCLKDVCDSLGLQVGATTKRLGGVLIQLIPQKKQTITPTLVQLT